MSEFYRMGFRPVFTVSGVFLGSVRFYAQIEQVCRVNLIPFTGAALEGGCWIIN